MFCSFVRRNAASARLLPFDGIFEPKTLKKMDAWAEPAAQRVSLLPFGRRYFPCRTIVLQKEGRRVADRCAAPFLLCNYAAWRPRLFSMRFSSESRFKPLIL